MAKAFPDQLDEVIFHVSNICHDLQVRSLLFQELSPQNRSLEYLDQRVFSSPFLDIFRASIPPRRTNGVYDAEILRGFL